MHEQLRNVAGLETLFVRSADAAKPELTVVFLHGYGMRAADLTPFAHSLAIARCLFVFPQAPLAAPLGGHAWWPIDEEARGESLAQGPRDLAFEHVAERGPARAALAALAAQLRREGDGDALLLAGFSQGGMLACDSVLLGGLRVAGLAMLSASCIALDEWQPERRRLRGLRAFVSHGREDRDLAFSAGERVQQFLTAAEAAVTWVPFDGGHAIPFAVWRHFRGFVQATMHPAAFTEQHERHYGTS